MARIPRLRIVAEDEDPRKAKVYDAETGQQITNVVSIAIAMDANTGLFVVELHALCGFEYEGPGTLHVVPMDVTVVDDYEGSGLDERDAMSGTKR